MEFAPGKKHIKGLGFRGTIYGDIVYDAITFKGEQRIYMNGKGIKLEETYTLALPDMFTFGYFFKEVLPSKQKNISAGFCAIY